MQGNDFDEARFFLGSVCKRQHDWNGTGHSLRKIKKGECVDCSKVAGKEWRKRNPEKTAEGRTKYNQQERVKEYKRQHHLRNSDRYKELHRKRYEENKAEHLAKCKAYYLEHREETLAYCRRYQMENRDRIAVQHREYYQKHRDRFAVLSKVYREENRELIRARKKEYRATPGHKLLKGASSNRRRTRKRNNHQVPYSHDELTTRIKAFQGNCAYCDKKLNLIVNRGLTWDHFIPISRGGSDCIGNLIPSCDRCNVSKSDRDPWEWYQSQESFTIGRWKKLLKILGKNQGNYEQIPFL